jgi:hypothetical protein
MNLNLPALSRTWFAFAPIWVSCGCCADFWCRLHERHVADCSCPPVECWLLSPHLH